MQDPLKRQVPCKLLGLHLKCGCPFGSPSTTNGVCRVANLPFLDRRVGFPLPGSLSQGLQCKDPSLVSHVGFNGNPLLLEIVSYVFQRA